MPKVKPTPRVSHAAGPLRLLAPLLVAALAALAVALARPGRELWQSGGAPQQPANRLLLLDILSELRRAWKPAAQAAALARAKDNLESIETPLGWLLTQHSHALLPQALRIAGEFRVRLVRDRVLELAAIAGLRAKALDCADHIEPFPMITVQEFLEGSDKEVVLAAVAMAARRHPPPAAQLVELLAHPAADVRQRAVEALPAQLGPELASTLQQMVVDRPPEVAVLALAALARVPRSAELEQLLAAQMAHQDERVIAAALAALAQNGGKVGTSTLERLWHLADTATNREVRARAFLCLERTGSHDVADVEARMPTYDAFGRYFGARLLVAAGKSTGAEALIDLVTEVQGNESAAPLSVACRTLLGSIANKQASATVEEWRAWLADAPLEGPRTLPPPPPGL